MKLTAGFEPAPAPASTSPPFQAFQEKSFFAK